MSRPQEPHRPFFPFGNPFRMKSPKGSHLSPGLLSLLNAFEEKLAERLTKLEPKDVGDVLSLSWMRLAMESLCQTHEDIKNLITALELPVCDWDEKWIDVYLDISVKLLDLCNAFSSEISRVNQGHLLLQCVLHNLESSSPQQFVRARSSIDGWRRHMTSKSPRLDNCSKIIDSLMESLDLPKVKNSAKGKVLMRAMYGVKVQTIFVCSIFIAAFSGTPKKLELNIPDTFSWGRVFINLLTNVHGGVKNLTSCSGAAAVKELQSVDASIKKLYPLIHDGVDPIDEQAFRDSVVQLKNSTEKLSQGLDLLSKGVDGFFQIVLTGRDALLCNLRSNGTIANPIGGRHVEQRA